MYSATPPSLLRSFVFRIGILFLILAIAMWIALSLSTAHEQALTPGEKSLGVAALAMLLGVPALVFGSISVLCLIFSLAVAGYRKLASRKRATASPSQLS
jgi:hypothetical protein